MCHILHSAQAIWRHGHLKWNWCELNTEIMRFDPVRLFSCAMFLSRWCMLISHKPQWPSKWWNWSGFKHQSHEKWHIFAERYPAKPCQKYVKSCMPYILALKCLSTTFKDLACFSSIWHRFWNRNAVNFSSPTSRTFLNFNIHGCLPLYLNQAI